MKGDIFDPNLYPERAQLVAALKREGIPCSHRLAARLESLGRRQIFFSYAFLEAAGEEEAYRKVLQDGRWQRVSAGDEAEVASIVAPCGAWTQAQGAGLAVYSGEERREESQLPAPLGEERSLVTSVLGPVDWGALGGVLWDRQRLEEASLTLLDGEDIEELLAAFRYLLRAALACRQDPAGLLVTALKRNKPALTAEVARQVRDNLDRDLGRALEQLLSGQAAQFKEALLYFAAPHPQRLEPILGYLLWPSLIALAGEEKARSYLLPSLSTVAPLLARFQKLSAKAEDAPQGLRELLDLLLDALDSLQLVERLALSAFIYQLAPHFPELGAYLWHRFRLSTQPSTLAFLGNLLARLPQREEDYQELKGRLIALWVEKGQEAWLARRLRATFKLLGSAVLVDLSQAPFLDSLDEGRRLAVVQLWQDFKRPWTLEEGQSRGRQLRPEERDRLFVEYVRGRLASQDRASLIFLAHTDQLQDPLLLGMWEPWSPENLALASFLLAQAALAAEPERQRLLKLLAAGGERALEWSFKNLQGQLTLGASVGVNQLEAWATLLHLLPPREATSQARREEMVAQIAAYPALQPEFLASQGHLVEGFWTVWGLLGSAPALSDALRLQFVERLQSDLEAGSSAKVEALMAIYRVASRAVRLHLEGEWRRLLGDAKPQKKLLSALLSALRHLLEDGPLLEEPQALLGGLCRTVLQRGAEPNLELLMLKTLAPGEEGDGVQLSQAWSYSDKLEALRLLGAAASHPQASQRLRELLIYRLFSFLDDWFEGLEKGDNPYAYRSNPLWAALTSLLERERSNFTLDLARRAALRLVNDYRRAVAGVDLVQSEGAQKYLQSVLQLSWGVKMELQGQKVEVDEVWLQTLLEVAQKSPPENRSALTLLHELLHDRHLPPEHRIEIELFLAPYEGHS